MRKYILLFILAVLFYVPGCQQCEKGDDACYKSQYLLVPDANKASGYRYLTLGEFFWGEKNKKN